MRRRQAFQQEQRRQQQQRGPLREQQRQQGRQRREQTREPWQPRPKKHTKKVRMRPKQGMCSLFYSGVPGKSSRVVLLNVSGKGIQESSPRVNPSNLSLIFSLTTKKTVSFLLKSRYSPSHLELSQDLVSVELSSSCHFSCKWGRGRLHSDPTENANALSDSKNIVLVLCASKQTRNQVGNTVRSKNG